MKLIFEERTKVGSSEWTKVVQRRRNGYNYLTDTEVVRSTLSVAVSTTAHYDKKLHVLIVDCTAGEESECAEWLPQSRRVLETVNTLPTAQRRAIELADAWIADVRNAIPPRDERTDEEIIAAKQQEPDRVEVPF